MDKKYYMWSITANDYIEIVELAQKHGKKEGDSMEEEVLEVMEKKDKKPFGTTNKDVDMLTGELRDKGLKVRNLKEEERRKQNES